MSNSPMQAIGKAAAPAAAESGLTAIEARARLARYGPNDPTRTRQGAAFFELLRLFLNPLVIILLVASGISAALGQKTDAAIIFAIVIASITIDFVQTYRSHLVIQKLRETVTPTATVLRDGEWREVHRVEVVPGDMVRLSAGDLVPADGLLLEARDLFIQQAALTGESMPEEKTPRAPAVEEAGESISANKVYLGTSVVSGTGTARIYATGANTAIRGNCGAIGGPAGGNGIRARTCGDSACSSCASYFSWCFSSWWCGSHFTRMRSNHLLFAVALAVGLTPEFLPMITSVTLASGAVRMAREQVVVKHLPAIQNFGSIDVFCSDKTGTLTTGEMTLNSLTGHIREILSTGPWRWPISTANSKLESAVRWTRRS